jgi:hypothetical protein
MKKFVYSLLLSFLFSVGFSQTAPSLSNASFEQSNEQVFWLPASWEVCERGSELVKLMNFAPSAGGVQSLVLLSEPGKSSGAIAQKLSSALTPDKHYRLYGFVASATGSMSFGGNQQKVRGGLRLRIAGGKSNCEAAETIGMSQIGINSNWVTFEIDLKISKELDYLIIDAIPEPGVPSAYRGLFIDKLYLHESSEPIVESKEKIKEEPRSVPVPKVDPVKNAQGAYAPSRAEKMLRPVPEIAPKSQWEPSAADKTPSAIITLNNPSFEDKPQHSRTPFGWTDCGFAGESEPDIQPNTQFAVNTKPFNGNTYLGMVVRDNSTWERVGQRLSASLMKDSTYHMSLALARSASYLSMSRIEEKLANHNTPTILRVWGANKICQAEELLAETSPIVNFKWETYTLKLNPKQNNYRYLILEVFYQPGEIHSYNGNLLIDNLSELRLVNSRQ